ncbi:MAG: BlaI/MecI/CopY family transcriptional regulator [bacterium]
MSRKSTGRPTNAELAILSVLWENGPGTVREVHDKLDGDVGYTTVLKLMQIMTEKGLVERDESQRAHVYSATRPREETQGNLVGDLITRAFDGSASKLVLQALANRPTSKDELDQIRQLLDDLESQSGEPTP